MMSRPMRVFNPGDRQPPARCCRLNSRHFPFRRRIARPTSSGSGCLALLPLHPTVAIATDRNACATTVERGKRTWPFNYGSANSRADRKLKPPSRPSLFAYRDYVEPNPAAGCPRPAAESVAGTVPLCADVTSAPGGGRPTCDDTVGAREDLAAAARDHQRDVEGEVGAAAPGTGPRSWWNDRVAMKAGVPFETPVVVPGIAPGSPASFNHSRDPARIPPV